MFLRSVQCPLHRVACTTFRRYTHLNAGGACAAQGPALHWGKDSEARSPQLSFLHLPYCLQNVRLGNEMVASPAALRAPHERWRSLAPAIAACQEEALPSFEVCQCPPCQRALVSPPARSPLRRRRLRLLPRDGQARLHRYSIVKFEVGRRLVASVAQAPPLPPFFFARPPTPVYLYMWVWRTEFGLASCPAS